MANSGVDDPHSLSKPFLRTFFLMGTACACSFVKLVPTFILCFRKGLNLFQFLMDLSSMKWILVELLQTRHPSSPSFGFLCSDCIKTATSVVPPVVSLPWEAELAYYMILACKIWVKCSTILVIQSVPRVDVYPSTHRKRGCVADGQWWMASLYRGLRLLLLSNKRIYN